MGTVHRAAEVRAHYASLAATYDDKANRACKRHYERLIRRSLSRCRRVLEIGAGSSPVLGVLEASLGVACDLSLPMLAARRTVPNAPRTVADGQQLPFRDGAFDGAFCVNVLEHAPDPGALVAEAARVLAPGGKFLAITPNGDAEGLLDLLERLKLKLPEGPHRFVTFGGLAALAGEHFTLVEHRKCLAFPAGPEGLVRWVDGLAGEPGWGLFQYAVMWKR
jgi:SAM-dependent methyltransferase